MTLRQLRRALGPPTATEDGWRRFGANVAVQLVRGRVRRVRARVRPNLDCGAAARREGFVEALEPVAGAICRWPVDVVDHRLEPEGRVAGRFDPESATLEVWFPN